MEDALIMTSSPTSSCRRQSNERRLWKEKGYTYQLLLKGETVAEAYHATLLPTVYVIGPEGKIVYRGTSTETLTALIEDYLKPRH